jgi:hypothetical protein
MSEGWASARANGLRSGSMPVGMFRAEDLLPAIVLVALASKFLLIFRININWDEFYFLSLVHDYLRGTLSGRFQTLHVHLFTWLPALHLDEAGQIIAGRLAMAAAATASALLLYGIARRFLTRAGALFGVLAYLSTTVVVEHSASFRTDPIATLLALLSLYVTLRKPGGAAGIAIAGFAMAVSMLITIKSVFYLLVIGAAILLMTSGIRGRIRVALAFALPFAFAFAAGYLFHASSLAEAAPTSATGFLRGAASKVFLKDGLFPRWSDLLMIVAYNPLFWFMTIHGAAIAWRAARGSFKTIGSEAWLPLVLALPLLTPLFYRNAFAYYYVFILPPGAILVGLSFEAFRQRASNLVDQRATLFFPILVALQCMVLAAGVFRLLPDRIEPQRATLAAVHQVFPRPVPYIDGYGVVASFRRHGFFMSSWGMDGYHDAGQPVYPALVAEARPPLLLADSPSLYAALIPDVTVAERRVLLPEDIAFLKENYIQHWGMLFVAGKRIELSAAARPIAFDIAVSGAYRLEAAETTMIDGKELEPGEVATLAVGRHSIDAGSTTGEVVLRWAEALPPPAEDPPDLMAFFGIEP